MKYKKVAELVESRYVSSKEDFAQWMWKNHLPVVAKNAEALAEKYDANPDLAVAGAWLHDFGDAFTGRHSDDHKQITVLESSKLLNSASYTDMEIKEILEQVIGPHSCKDGVLPITIEGKVLATADALAHLTTDFYLQFAWKHLPDDHSYFEFVRWTNEKLDRDFYNKIFFDEIRADLKIRFDSLKEVFRIVTNNE